LTKGQVRIDGINVSDVRRDRYCHRSVLCWDTPFKRIVMDNITWAAQRF
jgi:hypothetical protein